MNRWINSLLLLAAATLSGCGWGLSGPMSTLDPDGPVAKVQYDSFLVTLWVSIAIFVAVGGLFLYCLLKFTVKGEVDRDMPLPDQGHGNPLLEVGMIFVSLLLVGIIVVPSIAAQFYSGTTPKDTQPLVIKVTGYQWWWKFDYPELGITTANEAGIPTGRPVRFHVQTADVLHAFWIPRLGGKVDLNPGQDNWLWYQADKPGSYWGQCTEFCGKSHAFMKMRVNAMEPTDFDQWVAAQKAPAVNAAAPPAFNQNQCQVCHTIRGVPGAQGLVGPDLTHVGSRVTIMAGVRNNSEGNLKAWLLDPEYHKPGNVMYKAGYKAMNIQMDESEADVLAKYLYSLK